MVKELDGQVMSIVPSEVGKVNAQADEETEWNWAIEGLREVYAHAQQAGVVVALEPLNRFETNFLNRHDQALALAEAVGPECGVCNSWDGRTATPTSKQAGSSVYPLHPSCTPL